MSRVISLKMTSLHRPGVSPLSSLHSLTTLASLSVEKS